MRKTPSVSPLVFVLAGVPVAAIASTAHAGECEVDGKLMSYLAPKQLPVGYDSRCDNVDGKCKKLDLKGWLYKPTSKGSHPVIVYNHGSGENVGDGCGFAKYFTALGYVVFMPQRRGHGESTGVYLSEYTNTKCSVPGLDNFCKMEYLKKQVGDVKSAVDFVTSLPEVDDDRLAIMGHSFGGIVTTFANTKDMGQKVIIDFAGASQSWEGNEFARKEMTAAVKNAVAPIYFFEPLNDASIEPTIALAKVAGESCKQFQSAMFAAVDVTGDDKITKADYSSERDPKTGDHNRDLAHGKSTRMFNVWGPSVHEFMQRYFKRPAKPFDKLCIDTSLVK